jgi:hypothetical protein
MKKKTITITVSAAIINAINLVLVPVSSQKIISQSIYLKTIKENIHICLS